MAINSENIIQNIPVYMYNIKNIIDVDIYPLIKYIE